MVLQDQGLGTLLGQLTSTGKMLMIVLPILVSMFALLEREVAGKDTMWYQEE
jgi:hypothetical protein